MGVAVPRAGLVVSARLLDLASIRRLSTDPAKLADELGRTLHKLDVMFRDLPSTFVERWKRRPETVTTGSDRPALRFGELSTIAAQGAGQTFLYLPSATPSDEGRRIQFVKTFTDQDVTLIPADGALINTFSRWGGMHQVGLHEIWWDGSAWWVKEPGARLRRHGLEHQPLGLWQFAPTALYTDSSGHGRTLTIESGTELTAFTHPSVGGFRLNGSTTLYYNVHDSALAITGDVTYEEICLLSSETNSAAFFNYVASGETEDTNQLYGMRFTSSAPAVEWVSEHGAGLDDTATLATSHQTPHQLCHWAVTRTSNVVQLYLNGRARGAPQTIANTPTGGTSAAARFRIGPAARTLTSAKLIGKSLSAAEIAAEYNRTMGPAFGFIDARQAA
jgi:hypothetical protein